MRGSTECDKKLTYLTGVFDMPVEASFMTDSEVNTLQRRCFHKVSDHTTLLGISRPLSSSPQPLRPLGRHSPTTTGFILLNLR